MGIGRFNVLYHLRGLGRLLAGGGGTGPIHPPRSKMSFGVNMSPPIYSRHYDGYRDLAIRSVISSGGNNIVTNIGDATAGRVQVTLDGLNGSFKGDSHGNVFAQNTLGLTSLTMQLPYWVQANRASDGLGNAQYVIEFDPTLLPLTLSNWGAGFISTTPLGNNRWLVKFAAGVSDTTKTFNFSWAGAPGTAKVKPRIYHVSDTSGSPNYVRQASADLPLHDDAAALLSSIASHIRFLDCAWWVNHDKMPGDTPTAWAYRDASNVVEAIRGFCGPQMQVDIVNQVGCGGWFQFGMRDDDSAMVARAAIFAGVISNNNLFEFSNENWNNGTFEHFFQTTIEACRRGYHTIAAPAAGQTVASTAKANAEANNAITVVAQATSSNSTLASYALNAGDNYACTPNGINIIVLRAVRNLPSGFALPVTRNTPATQAATAGLNYTTGTNATTVYTCTTSLPTGTAIVTGDPAYFVQSSDWDVAITNTQALRAGRWYRAGRSQVCWRAGDAAFTAKGLLPPRHGLNVQCFSSITELLDHFMWHDGISEFKFDWETDCVAPYMGATNNGHMTSFSFHGVATGTTAPGTSKSSYWLLSDKQAVWDPNTDADTAVATGVTSLANAMPDIHADAADQMLNPTTGRLFNLQTWWDTYHPGLGKKAHICFYEGGLNWDWSNTSLPDNTAAWSATSDYTTGYRTRSGNTYKVVSPSGPSNGGAQDPALDTTNTFWKVVSKATHPVFGPAPRLRAFFEIAKRDSRIAGSQKLFYDYFRADSRTKDHTFGTIFVLQDEVVPLTSSLLASWGRIEQSDETAATNAALAMMQAVKADWATA